MAFISDVDELYPGECVTLQWTTRNATDVYLDQWIVDVPAGQRIFCYDELALGTTGFRLTAVNSVDSVLVDLYIEVYPPSETTISVPFVPNLSGAVSDSGGVYSTIYPGDDAAYDNFIGFITFDITNLPSNATIKSASLDLGTCFTDGDPFTDLGDQLYVTYLYYGDLDASDYYASGGDYLGSVYGCPGGQIDVTASIDAHKAPAYWQITLSWPSRSDFDNAIDDVTYSSPSLEIVYMP